MTKLRADDPTRLRIPPRKVKPLFREFKLQWEEKWKSLSVHLAVYGCQIIRLYVSKFREEKLHYSLSLFGYMSRALFSIDRAHMSKLYPLHSIFWICLTKFTSGEGEISGG